MASLSKFLSKLSLWFSAAGLVGMTLIIGWQVFARYILDAAPAWTEQASLFLMLWFILFASAAGVRENFHIRISLVLDIASQAKRKVLSVIGNLVVLLFGIAMAYNGCILVLETWQHTIPTLGLPRGTAYFPVVVAGAFITFFAAEQILCEVNETEVEPLWN